MTNVLIYIVDALRADHLSCYGYHRPTSPNIDALAADPAAVRFTQAFAPSTWTKPVAASILSGCYPPAHGVRTRSDLFLRSVPRLPLLLQEAGYRTAGVSTIGNVSSSLGFALGFDQFVDLYKDPALAQQREVSNTGAWKLYFEEDTTVVLPLAEDVNAACLALAGRCAPAGRSPGSFSCGRWTPTIPTFRLPASTAGSTPLTGAASTAARRACAGYATRLTCSACSISTTARLPTPTSSLAA